MDDIYRTFAVVSASTSPGTSVGTADDEVADRMERLLADVLLP